MTERKGNCLSNLTCEGAPRQNSRSTEKQLDKLCRGSLGKQFKNRTNEQTSKNTKNYHTIREIKVLKQKHQVQ
jgi:hypothetical protein